MINKKKEDLALIERASLDQNISQGKKIINPGF